MKTRTVENGNSVELHYKGTFPDGKVFDDSRVRGETMNVLVGNGQLIKGFESALIGMTEGQVKTVSLTSDEAYGPTIPEAVVKAPVGAFPPDFPFEVGMPVMANNPNGESMMATIISFDENEVTLDHNHPLAGKDLNFEIELVKIEENTELNE